MRVQKEPSKSWFCALIAAYWPVLLQNRRRRTPLWLTRRCSRYCYKATGKKAPVDSKDIIGRIKKVVISIRYAYEWLMVLNNHTTTVEFGKGRFYLKVSWKTFEGVPKDLICLAVYYHQLPVFIECSSRLLATCARTGRLPTWIAIQVLK